jgi:hypothetical protein
MRRGLLLLLGSWAFACAKAPPAPAVEGGARVGVAIVLLGEDGPATPELPDLHRMIAEQLGRDGARAVPVATGSALIAASSTKERAQVAAAAASDADWVLLLEVQPGFVSQVAGQYRWQVGATLSVAPVATPEQVRSWEREIPVYLRFYHEQEVEAVEGAAARLERHLAHALEEAGVVAP